MTNEHSLKEGQQLSLKIKRLGINGEGIGYYKRTIVFVPGALPDETVTTTLSKIAPRYVEGSLTKIDKKSSNRVTPPCPVYDTCGGCQLQHLAYPAQLDFKQDVVIQALQKFKPKGYETYKVLPTLGMENPWQYRNKLQFQIRKTSSGEVQAGLYQPDSHELVAINDCLVQRPLSTKVVNVVVSLLEKYQVPIYDEVTNSGIVKTLMVREAIATEEVQLVFITQSKKLPKKRQLLEEINELLPEVVSIMQNVHPKKTSLVMGEDTLHLWGNKSIKEQLDDVTFELSPRAFFQLNPEQTQVLYKEVRKALDSSPEDRIVDAYCGVGTIGLSLAKHVKEVRGMDTIPSAIEDATHNSEEMGVTNTYYEVGTAETVLPKWFEEGFRPSGIIVDPPRTGLDSKLITALLTYPSQKLVYVSCNPSTLGRDLVQLSQKYQVDYLQSVDMFPQTARAEVVAKLSLRPNY